LYLLNLILTHSQQLFKRLHINY